MITQLGLKGFKSFVNECVSIKPLTVLTGLNSSGKSSIIQGVRMFDALYKGKSALLEGHGSLQEMKSRLTSSMLLTMNLADGNTMTFDGITFSSERRVDFPHITYIGANRVGASQTIPVLNESYEIGEKGENVLNCLNHYEDQTLDERLKPKEGEGLTLDFMVKGWLKYISPGVKFDYQIEPKADVSFGTYNGNRAANVGFGLSYTLPIIVALLTSTIIPNSVVLIENPEAHLHPKGQTEMGRLIGLCVECGSQVIVETHSDHLFDGIRIFTKRTRDFSDKMVAYWVEQHYDKGSSVLPIYIDNNGRYTEDCPRGFFDQFENNANELLF